MCSSLGDVTVQIFDEISFFFDDRQHETARPAVSLSNFVWIDLGQIKYWNHNWSLIETRLTNLDKSKGNLVKPNERKKTIGLTIWSNRPDKTRWPRIIRPAKRLDQQIITKYGELWLCLRGIIRTYQVRAVKQNKVGKYFLTTKTRSKTKAAGSRARHV